MVVYGIDFTSRPSGKKPLTCFQCRLEDSILIAVTLKEWHGFDDFEAALRQPGPWIAGMDFPFGQASYFIQKIGWPKEWSDYVSHVGQLTRNEFRAALDGFRESNEVGNKEHRRHTDVLARSISPQKLYGTPVGLMFYEGAPRIKASGASIPLLQDGDPERTLVEAYPGVLARDLIGRRSYKQDTKSKQTREQREARVELLDAITADKGEFQRLFGFRVSVSRYLIDEMTKDPGADRLDALLCAAQAAWAHGRKDGNYGIPASADSSEGWIVHPTLLTP